MQVLISYTRHYRSLYEVSEKSDENCVVKVNSHKYDWIRIQVGLIGLNEV